MHLEKPRALIASKRAKVCTVCIFEKKSEGVFCHGAANCLSAVCLLYVFCLSLMRCAVCLVSVCNPSAVWLLCVSDVVRYQPLCVCVTSVCVYAVCQVYVFYSYGLFIPCFYLRPFIPSFLVLTQIPSELLPHLPTTRCVPVV